MSRSKVCRTTFGLPVYPHDTAANIPQSLLIITLASERAQKKAVSAELANDARKAEAGLSFTAPISETSGLVMLCAVRGIGRTLDFAVQEARETDRPLYLLFVREQPILAPEDRKRKWVVTRRPRRFFPMRKVSGRAHHAALLCRERLRGR
jgi:hypothetical protein